MSIFDKCPLFTTAKDLEALGRYAYFRPIEEATTTEAKIGGEWKVMVGSNNYLGLTHHPKVLEAVVVGIHHPTRGDDTVKAYIVPKPGEQPSAAEIKEFCKQHLAPYKVPREVEFRAELPKTMVGKVLRRVLIEEERQKSAAKTAGAPAEQPATA